MSDSSWGYIFCTGYIVNLLSQPSSDRTAIRVLNNQRAHSGQYILDAIHFAVECLHAKQDGLINRVMCQRQIEVGKVWSGKHKG